MPDLATLLFHQLRQAEADESRVFGPVIGIVTDNKDPEKLARVKVKYPTLPGSDTSWWAPIVASGAGKNRGWFFLPEVDDEVLVIFEHGDFNRPVIIGALWNGKDKPPDTNGGKNERCSIVSRGGSKITFDDKEEAVIIEDGGGIAKVTISKKKKKIILEATQGDVCIHAPKGELGIVAKELTCKAQVKCVINAKGDSNIGADGNGTFKANMQLQIQGAAGVELKPGSATEAAKAEAKCEKVKDPFGA